MTAPTSSQPDSPTDSPPISVDTHSTNSPSTTHAPIITNRPQRIRNPPSHLTDYVCNHTSLSTDFPIANNFSLSFLGHSHRAFLLKIMEDQESRSYSQATKSVKWCDAMAKEIQALESNNTWSLYMFPSQRKITHWL